MRLTVNKSALYIKSKPKGNSLPGASRRVNIYVLILLTLPGFLLFSCKSGGELAVKPLFMQSKRANIELPDAPAGLQGALSEQVSYRHADNASQVLLRGDSIKKMKQSGRLQEMQYLNEVVVTARTRSKFAPERDGRVRVDFIVHVPKELLDDSWRVTLFPRLLHNDSVVALDKLVLRGKIFAQKQAQDYKDYESYVSSIISPSAYDSIFLDRKSIAKRIRSRQEYYWDLYNKQRKEIDKYLRRRKLLDGRYQVLNSHREGKRLEKYHNAMLRGEEHVLRLLATGRDTTGIMASYLRKFENPGNQLPESEKRREFVERLLTGRDRDFYLNGIKPEDIPNLVTTEEDSIGIARHSYFYGAIAENESRQRRMGEVEKELIPFPEEGGARLDSIVAADAALRYYYSQDYRVMPGLRSLRVFMDGRVDATDRSAFSLAGSDTLTYMISSLAQLADTTLMVKETRLYRSMYNTVSIYPKFAPDKSSFDISLGDNRLQADTLISIYKKLTGEMGLQLDSLTIQASASLEGYWDKNHELSAKRADALKDYLVSAYPSSYSGVVVRTSSIGEDWKGLVQEIRKREDITHKDSILSLLGRAISPDDTERELKTRFSRDYKVIRDSVYPMLQRMDLVFHVSRPHMVSADSTQYEIREGYGQGLAFLQQREYMKALELLAPYGDYNTALCLACLGYNGRAYDILVRLPATANSEYLLAIVSYRMGKPDEAAGHLVRAVELDPRKAYRASLDSEILELVREKGLDAQLERLGNAHPDVLPEETAPEPGTAGEK